ncbi:MAG: hypothetical protein JNL96_20845 [Planctomycetaceae bacterium]|nr:hypothetical protein [Planctomycetaceae bacterium]
MSVILVDLGNEAHDVVINNAGWRATVEVVRAIGVLEERRLELLETAWLGERVAADEARAIGHAVLAGPLADVNWLDDVYPPQSFWKDPATKSWPEYDRDTYWTSWLRAFAGFCLTCDGFVVH